MSKTLTPARAVSPGQILERELEARNWTQKYLAEIMNRPPQAINEIIKGTKQITPETALELSAVFGTTAEFWTNLEAKYRLRLVKKNQDNEEIKRRSRLYTLAPIPELLKRQWIKPSKSLDELEQSVCKFLGIKSPEDTPQLSVNFRHSQILEPEYNAKLAWCKRVEQVVSKQSLGKFQTDKLQAAIPSILSYAKREEDVAYIPKLLTSLGIHFAIVPHLSKTYIDGAAFYLGDYPVIALTLRYDRIDCFWFSLMHEIGHIVAGHQDVYLDNLENLEESLEEEEANKIARDWLLDERMLKAFIGRTKPRFSKKAIVEFAQTQNRHPGIILGCLQHDGVISYRNLRNLLVKVKPFLSNWIDE